MRPRKQNSFILKKKKKQNGKTIAIQAFITFFCFPFGSQHLREEGTGRRHLYLTM